MWYVLNLLFSNNCLEIYIYIGEKHLSSKSPRWGGLRGVVTRIQQTIDQRMTYFQTSGNQPESPYC